MPVRIFDEREIGLLQEVLASGKLSGLGGGQLTPRFEAAFATPAQKAAWAARLYAAFRAA